MAAADCFDKTTLRLFNQRQEASPPLLSIRRNISKNKQEKKSQQVGPRLTGHLVGKPSPRQLSRSAKQPPASLRAPDTAKHGCEGGRGHKKVKVLLCFLASLLISSGLNRMKLARKILAARALLVLAANCWLCFLV